MVSDLMLLFDEVFFLLFCRQSVDFSLQCAWLLEAYSPASLEGLTKKNRSHGIKLKNLIMSGELIPKSANGESKKAITETVSNNKAPPHSHHNHRRTHIRSRSDASALISSSVRGKLLDSELHCDPLMMQQKEARRKHPHVCFLRAS